MCLSFAELDKMKYYQLSRPLLVIIISTWNNLEEFSMATKKINVSLYVWFVLFVEMADVVRLKSFCKDPIGNIFNLNFDTEMLILCYDETILKEWYIIIILFYDKTSRYLSLSLYSLLRRCIYFFFVFFFFFLCASLVILFFRYVFVFVLLRLMGQAFNCHVYLRLGTRYKGTVRLCRISPYGNPERIFP